MTYSSAGAQEAGIFSEMDRLHPVWAENGMVSAQEREAAEIGRDILAKGGNAVDAGVAVAFALAVTLPRAGNIGGGGFMFIHDAESGDTKAIDYREMAPSGASRDMFLNDAGEADSTKSLQSGAASGVPGTVAGMRMALDTYGSMDWAEVIAPAIRLAEKGISVTPELADSLEASREEFMAYPDSAAIFLKPDGSGWRPGELLVQADLAQTLRTVAEQGPDGFYKGAVAENIAKAIQAAGGPMTVDDLAAYKPVMREPVRGTYRGYDIVSMPPPSSGGVHLIQILNTLEGYPIGPLGHNSAETIHLMAEAMKLAYADRSEYLGDPDFVDVPAEALTSKDYAASLREKIGALATPSAMIAPGDLGPYESDQTTHFSIVDKDGNAVSNTYTINLDYGSGLVAGGTGVLMNNEMDDFSAKPGVPNAFGLIGGEANAVEAGKRPLSSMTPTLVLKDGEVWLATGSPGGARIITTTLQVIMNMIDHGMNVAEASTAPRVHHQWLPDELRVEEGISVDTLRLLSARGHSIAEKPVMGSTQTIMRDVQSEALLGASDPRRPDAATVGF
ncbi:gamma-glutamyltransferase [Cereibacter sp. SYSU M97828]|nr:gamma-glutamyltransferase [Cereibacter flavus]